MSEETRAPRYPWAELYDLESGVKPIRRARRTPGRPPRPVARHKTSITLLDEEKRIYDRLAYELGSHLHPNKVTKSQVLGLALRLLDARLAGLEDGVDSWEALAAALFAEGEGPDG